MHACVSCSATPACHTPSFLEWSQEPRSHAQGLRGGGKIHKSRAVIVFLLEPGHRPWRESLPRPSNVSSSLWAQLALPESDGTAATLPPRNLRLDDPVEFGEGDVGPAGGIQAACRTAWAGLRQCKDARDSHRSSSLGTSIPRTSATESSQGEGLPRDWAHGSFRKLHPGGHDPANGRESQKSFSTGRRGPHRGRSWDTAADEMHSRLLRPVQAERCQRLFKMYQKAVKPGPQCCGSGLRSACGNSARGRSRARDTPAMISPLRPRLRKNFLQRG